MSKQDKRYSDEHQVNFGLLSEHDSIYKNTTNERRVRPRLFELIKLALIITTSCAIISTMGIVIVHLLSSYDQAETLNNNQPVINGYQELRADLEDWSILPEKPTNPELNPKIDVHLIVDQMINHKKNSLKVVPTEADILSTTMGTTTTIAPIIDYLLATIVINRATVPNKDGIIGLTDAFVKVLVDDNYIGQTPAHKETLSPVWNYQIIQDLKVGANSKLGFEVWDSDKYTTHEFIGKCAVRISDLMSNGSKGKVVDVDYGLGRLWFTVNWEEVYKKP